MSLINDALKRTRDAKDESGPVPPAVSVVPPRPQLDRAATGRSHTTTWVVSLLVIAVILGGGSLLTFQFGRVWSRQRLDIYPATMTPPPTSPRSIPGYVEPPVSAVTNVQPTVAVTEPVVTNLSAPPVATTVVVVAPPPVPPPVQPARPRPVLALQGVGIQGQDRDALINGITVRVGEEIEGAKVLEIQRDWVRLAFDGQEYKLYR
jgi:hypothetical protein